MGIGQSPVMTAVNLMVLDQLNIYCWSNALYFEVSWL